MGFSESKLPSRDPARVYVLRVKERHKRTMCILGMRIQVFEGHWNGHCTIQHFNHGSKCPGCDSGLSLRCYGFLHCYDWQENRECFLELPEGAARQLQSLFPDPERLRGQKFEVNRSAAGSRGRLQFSYLQPDPGIEKAPPTKDATPTVNWLWGMSN